MKHQRKVKVIYNFKNISKRLFIFKNFFKVIYHVDIATQPQKIISSSPLVNDLHDLNENSSKENDLILKNSQLQLLIDSSIENRTGKL